MKSVVSGGTGFLGEPLVTALLELGEVVVLSRNPQKVRLGRGVAWDASPGGDWTREIDGADVVVNLAGENIGEGRWTDEKKKRLVQSRLGSTRALVEAMNRHPRPDRVFVSVSGINYYGGRGDELLDETSAPGDDFLARLCLEWEAAASGAGCRTVIPRMGMVLAGEGGALAKMALPFRFFVGGKVGSGRQWVAWVTRDDVIRFFLAAIHERRFEGAYNLVAPNPVENAEFTRALAATLRRPAIFTVPAPVIRLVFGEMGESLLLSGQRAVPMRAVQHGFEFEDPRLEPALRKLL